MKRRLDISRLSSVASRPGVDPRTWITWASVRDIGFDAEQGIFADVTFIPTGETETVFVGSDYAGGEFGAYSPIEVGDIVVVAIPNGDPGAGGIIVGRAWRGADKPSANFKADQQVDGNDVPTDNVVLRVRPGKKYVIRTSDSGGDIDIKVEGDGATTVENAGSGAITVKQTGTGGVSVTTNSGDISINSGSGSLKLEDASQPYVRGTDYSNALSSFLTALTTYTASLAAGNPLLPVLISVAASAAASLAPSIIQFQTAHTQYLSTKIKGQ